VPILRSQFLPRALLVLHLVDQRKKKKKREVRKLKILELELECFEATFEGLMNVHDELVRDLQLGMEREC